MNKIWRFEIQEGNVSYGKKERPQLTQNKRGCNEPFKNRFWCPKKKWFMKECCPFVNSHECENYKKMCGGIL